MVGLAAGRSHPEPAVGRAEEGMQRLGTYDYSGYLWPSFISTALLALLAAYGWRHRGIPGAVPFTLGCLFAVAWSTGAMFQTAATDIDVKTAWLYFQTLWQLPVVTAATCFVLEYAGLKRWLTRPVLVLLAVPPVVFAILILTNGAHHLVWTGFQAADALVPARGPANIATLAYSYVLAVLNVAVLVWLFVTSPRHRWPAALMIAGQVCARILHLLRVDGPFAGRWDADPFVLLVVFSLYAVALFRFHALDPVPEAQRAAIDQMVEGMVVLDTEGRILDANPAAERALGSRTAELRGRPAHGLLPDPGRDAPGEAVARDATAPLDGAAADERRELELHVDGAVRRYSLLVAPLQDRRGRALGRLILLHDVTEERAAQTRLLEQQRALATLQERERLARELHDTVGQVLGYVSLQAQTAGKKVADGDAEAGGRLLARLADVAQRAHADVRESILALSTASEQWSFLPALRRYLDQVRADYGVRTELKVPADLGPDPLAPEVAVQVLRVVQEAVTNARRHAPGCAVLVALEHRGDELSVTVADDGCGFAVASAEAGHNGHYGLTFMQERMRQVGGSVDIVSQPGLGTSVNLTARARATLEGRR
jgi:PAS domain S-box-containing protein